MSDNYSIYHSGWEYISALFCYFKDLVSEKERESHIAPKYIYRGISKRYFTESLRLENIVKDIPNRKTLIVDGIILKKAQINDISKVLEECGIKRDNDNNSKKECTPFEELYNRLYDKLKTYIEIITPENSDTQKSSLDGIQSHIDVLKKIHKNVCNILTQPEQIRSGASVRLRDVDKKYLTISDYLSYINNLIYDFKKINPEFGDYSELEILAEIQHRGGASCLVDFSKNFLISLWFACNNHLKDPGYLFCYNVNEDALSEDNITILNKDRWEYPIEELLKFTRKTAQYSQGDKFRFWLWKPANINGRIARQDSIFVFGLEKFYAKSHNVDIITIPPQWKSPIIDALKTYYGITAETVFPDVDGYAGAHSKTSKIDTISQYLNINNVKNDCISGHNEILQRGMSCLLNGQYKLALDYFLRVYPDIKTVFNKGDANIEIEENFKLELIKVEVIYSIGLCYKKLREYNLAEFFLSEAFSLDAIFETDNKNLRIKLLKDKRKVVLSKFMKIADDYIDILCNLQKYDIARNVICRLKTKRILGQPMLSNNCMLEYTIQRLSILEAIKCTPTDEKVKPKLLPFHLKSTGDSVIFKGLSLYHYLIRCIICNPEHIINSKYQVKSKTKTYSVKMLFDEYIQNHIYEPVTISHDSDTNILWRFDDILTSINEHFVDLKYKNLREFSTTITYKIKSVFDILASRKGV